MKRSLRFLVLAAVTAFSSAALAEPSPIGRWKTIDDETGKVKSVVQIYEQGGKLFGKIERLFRGPTEDQNPKCDKCDGEKKDKPIIGMIILENLEKDDNEYTGGRITDPNNGKTYKCKIEVQEGGAKLKVRGFIGFSLLGRTQYWLKYEEPAAPAAPPAAAAPAQPAAPAAPTAEPTK